MRLQKSLKNPLKKSERKSLRSRSRARYIARKRVVHACCCKRRSRGRRSFVKCCSKHEGSVSDKLEALKTLIPHYYHQHPQNGSNNTVKAEQLFQETADYIIVLKTQVFVLQKLIEFYGADNNGSSNEKTDVQLQQHSH